MKVYKIKFQDKESKKAFSDYNRHNRAVIDDFSKKKSVIVRAADKDEVREMLAEAERGSYHRGDGYCFGTENEDYKIKNLADNEEDFDLEK